MKLKDVNIHETDDRLKHVKQFNSDDIRENVENLIKMKPFGEYSFYIFAHKRTIDIYEKFLLWETGKYKNIQEVPNARIIWQPRLKKPDAQANSMLFKVNPKDLEEVKICWIIPPEELWKSYEKGKITESEIVIWSIDQYKNNRRKLEEKEEDDLSDERISQIYKTLYPNLFKQAS